MSQSAIRSPQSEISLPASLEPEAASFLAKCEEAHVTPVRPRVDTNPAIFTELRNIVAYGLRYEDKVAACPCRALRLFAFAADGYTVCAAHGLLEIGQLRRPIAAAVAKQNGRKGGAK